MIVQFLGTAAGGGFPQWNCRCPGCQLARRNAKAAWPRSQSCVAVSADGARWLLLNASPDVRAQLAALPEPAGGVRALPFAAIVLTDAELDHTIGIPLLREGGRLHVYCTFAVRDLLTDGSGLLRLTAAFADVGVHPLSLDTPVEPVDLDGRGCGLRIEAFAVAGDPPRFAPRVRSAGGGAVVGLRIEDPAAGTTFVYVPSCGALSDDLRKRLEGSDAIAFDGTFWRDDEMSSVRSGHRTARQMGHVPISGDDGSLRWLGALPSARRVYTHINNTNPILIEDSPERHEVDAAGITVGYDGLRLDL